MKELSCTKCLLKNLCIPKHLKAADFKEFEDIIKHSHTLNRGEHIHHQDEPINSLFIIRSGSVKQYVSRNNNEEQILDFFLPGELIGLDSFNMPFYGNSVIALESTSYCTLPLSKFKSLYEKMPILQEAMLNLMSKTISSEKEMLLSACNKSADARFATFLLGLSRRYSTLGYPENQIHLSMSRQEMGNYLGLTSETVSRIITRFQNDKLISVNQKDINIPNMTKFENVCTSICH